jgi:hypothetical protein
VKFRETLGREWSNSGVQEKMGLNELIIIDVLTVTKKKRIALLAYSAI